MIETLASLAAQHGHTLVPTASAFVAVGGAHLGASTVAKELINWNPSNGSADADLLPDLETLRVRSRDITRNNGIAAGIVQTTHDNVVGTGPRLTAKPDYRALGRNQNWAEEWSQITEARWRAYAETRECDASWQLNFAAKCGEVFRAGMVNGEALALPLWLPWKGSTFNTRFQVIEADRLSNPFGRPDTEKMHGGIEIDRYGRPVAYHVRKTHPGDVFGFNVGMVGEWERIPSETEWGRARVIHAHDKERTGSTRGKPILSPVLAQFKMADTYIRTEMQAAAVNAFIAAFMETNLPPDHVAEMLGADPNSDQFQAFVNNQSQFVAPLKGAAIIPTMPGTKITPFAPGRPSEQFGPFIETVCRQIGVATGLPLELLLKDFSKTNYSSARAALLEAYRFFLGRRKWLTDFWCNPVYGLWLEEQVNGGFIDAPDFYENMYAYSRCSWIWPGRGWIDPVKEITAAEKRMVIGISTLERECAEQGDDWEEVQDQRAREHARLKKLGLPILQQPNIGTPPNKPAIATEEEPEMEEVAQ
jgi:lambda family phage portal protein